jgi:hypothetical protein
MTTSSHITSRARATREDDLGHAVPGAISLLIIIATGIAWYVMLGAALSSIH